VAPQPTPQFVLDCLGAEGAAPKTRTNLVDTGGARRSGAGRLVFKTNWTKREIPSTRCSRLRAIPHWTNRNSSWGRPRFQKMAASKEVDAIVIATPLIFIRSIWRQRSQRANTCTWKSGGRGCAGSFEGNRTRETRSREAEPGRGVPDPRLPAFCGIGAAHPWWGSGKSFAAKRTTFPATLTARRTRRYAGERRLRNWCMTACSPATSIVAEK